MMTKVIYIIVTYQGESNYKNCRVISVNGISNIESTMTNVKVCDKDIVYIHSIESIDKTNLELTLLRTADLLRSKGYIGKYRLMPLAESIDDNGKMTINKFPFLQSVDGKIKQARYAISF